MSLTLKFCCSLCERELGHQMDGERVHIKMCPDCSQSDPAERPSAPGLDFPRWSLKRTPARGLYLGRDKKDGNLVKLDFVKKLVARNQWLEKCIDRMYGAATTNFIDCPRCGFPNSEGYVCACGYNEGAS